MKNPYENVIKVVLSNGIRFFDNDDKDYDYTQPLMGYIEDYIWETEQDLGRETTEEEWVNCRNDWLEHFCISNEIKSLIIDGKEIKLPSLTTISTK